ncbi:MAG: hypothetical protein LBP59_09795 [Planctomycetaceae bacterium]|jgi:hypothetical protein|nr:hypothetical protein [Planctomycetaceae bacterium]
MSNPENNEEDDDDDDDCSNSFLVLAGLAFSIIIVKMLLIWFLFIYCFLHSVFYSWVGLIETLFYLLIIIFTPLVGGVFSLFLLVAFLKLAKVKSPIIIGKFRFNWE